MIREDRTALAEMGSINRSISDIVQRVIIEQRALSVREQHDFAQRLLRLAHELTERAGHGDTIGSFHLVPNPDDAIEPTNNP